MHSDILIQITNPAMLTNHYYVYLTRHDLPHAEKSLPSGMLRHTQSGKKR